MHLIAIFLNAYLDTEFESFIFNGEGERWGGGGGILVQWVNLKN